MPSFGGRSSSTSVQTGITTVDHDQHLANRSGTTSSSSFQQFNPDAAVFQPGGPIFEQQSSPWLSQQGSCNLDIYPTGCSTATNFGRSGTVCSPSPSPGCGAGPAPQSLLSPPSIIPQPLQQSSSAGVTLTHAPPHAAPQPSMARSSSSSSDAAIKEERSSVVVHDQQEERSSVVVDQQEERSSVVVEEHGAPTGAGVDQPLAKGAEEDPPPPQEPPPAEEDQLRNNLE